MFIIYAAVTLWVTLLSRLSEAQYEVHFTLFRALRKMVEIEGGMSGFFSALLKGDARNAFSLIHIVSMRQIDGIILNILMFTPLGYLVPAVWPKLGRWRRMLLLGTLCSLTIELLQGFFQLGVAEPDDIFNNTIGVFIGYLIYTFLIRFTHERIDKE